jgi:toxin ParE1/3/4
VNVDWLPSATYDLEDLRRYIERDDPGSAAVIADRLLNAVETLRDFPRRGRPGSETGTRELVVARTPYIVIYQIADEVVEILRIIHGARQWPPA